MLLRSVRAWVRGRRGVKRSETAKGEKRGDSNVSDNDIGYIYEAVKDKVSTLRLHHRHFKSRYPLVKVFDDFVGSRSVLLPLLLRRLLLPLSIFLACSRGRHKPEAHFVSLPRLAAIYTPTPGAFRRAWHLLNHFSMISSIDSNEESRSFP